MLTQSDISRYSRHLLLPEIGMKGQEKLKAASVLVVGAGGLGSPLLMYLAAAGVGRIGLVEFDVVDQSNLQRQILYSDSDIGRPKIEAAIERIQALNPLITLEAHEVRLTRDNALGIINRYDLVADGTDNFATRYLVNDACVLAGRPNVYASIFRFDGQVSIFGAVDGPCYRCLYPEPPPPGLVPNCAEGGVLGVLPGIVGSIQAVEVIKMITGIGETLIGRLLLFDALSMHFNTLTLRRDPGCPVCGESPNITELIDYDQFCGVTDPIAESREDHQKKNGEVEVNMFNKRPEYTPVELEARMKQNPDLILVDVRAAAERDIASIGGTHIPLNELSERITELEEFKESEIVVMCRSGVRSAHAQKFLLENGFGDVKNLAGGILAWSDTVDGSIPKY